VNTGGKKASKKKKISNIEYRISNIEVKEREEEKKKKRRSKRRKKRKK
jgi:hypothetical protein